jgi:hypothetical protein
MPRVFLIEMATRDTYIVLGCCVDAAETRRKRLPNFAPEITEEETKTRVHIDHSRMDATLPIRLCCKIPANQVKEGRESASSNFQLQVPHHTSRRLAEDMEKHGDGVDRLRHHHAIRVPLTAAAPGPAQFSSASCSISSFQSGIQLVGSLLHRRAR